MWKPRRWSGIVCAAVAVVAVAAGTARAGGAVVEPRLEARLREAGPTAEVPILVGLAGSAAPPAVAAAERSRRRELVVRRLRARAAARVDRLSPPLRSLIRARGRLLWGANAVQLQATAAMVRRLAADPAVAAIRLDATVRRPRLPEPPRPPSPPPDPGPPSAAWGPSAVGAPELWAAGLDGTGVVVASLDTGVDALHPDLAPRWRGGGNSWFDAAGQHAAPVDADGHGTRAMGLLLGGAASGGTLGVAPGARWIAARIFDDAGVTSLGAVHRAYQWILDPDDDPATDDAPDVVSNSWGLGDHPGECVGEFDADLAALRAAGIAVVFAAGNSGPGAGTSVSPANAPGVVSVGAVDAAGGLLDSSSRGPSACGGGTYPTLVAPGVAVRTTDLTFGGVVPQSYAIVDGTSFAAPAVAGGAALLRQACPTAPAVDLAEALAATAADLGPAGADNGFGAGLLDLPAAWDLLEARGSCRAEEDGGVGLEADGGRDDDGGGDGEGDGGDAPRDGGAPDGAPSPGGDASLGGAEADGGAGRGGGCAVAGGVSPGGAGLLAAVVAASVLRRRRRRRGSRAWPA